MKIFGVLVGGFFFCVGLGAIALALFSQQDTVFRLFLGLISLAFVAGGAFVVLGVSGFLPERWTQGATGAAGTGTPAMDTEAMDPFLRAQAMRYPEQPGPAPSCAPDVSAASGGIDACNVSVSAPEQN